MEGIPSGHLGPGPNAYVNPQWLAIPVRKPDSIANYYISGGGVADFTGDPAVITSNLDDPNRVSLMLEFARSDIDVLTEDDVYISRSGIAAVSIAHLDRDTEYTNESWLLGLTSIAVVDDAVVDKGQPKLWWKVEITAEYASDCWMDKLGYKIGFLVYRPPQVGWVWGSPGIAKMADVVHRFGDLLHGP